MTGTTKTPGGIAVGGGAQPGPLAWGGAATWVTCGTPVTAVFKSKAHSAKFACTFSWVFKLRGSVSMRRNFTALISSTYWRTLL